jgi:hypothetical protein
MVSVGLLGAGGNFDRDAPDCRPHFSRDELVQVAVCILSQQQQHSAPAGGRGQVRLPDLLLIHRYSSAFDPSSASASESGCSAYACRMRSYSASRIALLIAERMNSDRFRFASRACYI